MGYLDSIYTVLQVARVSVPTAAEAIVGRHTIEVGNARLRSFARRVVQRAGIEIEILGAENVPTDGAFVVMSNHQSHFDIPVLYHSLPVRTFRMVGKTELFQIPVWGRAMRAGGMIEIDRKDRASAIASLEAAKLAIASGISIWIAPEGSRSSGPELGELKRGGFYLARDTGTAIVPVAISNTGAVLPKGSLRVNRGVRVRVVIGAPIETAGSEIDPLVDSVREFLEGNITDKV